MYNKLCIKKNVNKSSFIDPNGLLSILDGAITLTIVNSLCVLV